jgi:hypothetical protein
MNSTNLHTATESGGHTLRKTTGRTTVTSDDAADQPPTAAAADNDATTIVPPPTQGARELAWSFDEGDDTMPVGRQPWRMAWGQAAVIAVCGAMLALAIGFAGWAIIQTHQHHDAASPSGMTTPVAVAGVCASTDLVGAACVECGCPDGHTGAPADGHRGSSPVSSAPPY